MNKALHVGVCVLALSGCGGVLIGAEDGGADGGVYSFDGLACDVATVLANRCVSCHGATPAGGAAFPLVTRAELLELAPGYPGETKAQRSVARMRANTMPPTGGNAAADLAVLEGWVDAGTPAGSCGPIIVGPVPTTCASGSRWTLGTEESPDMKPGSACVTCHKVQEAQKAWFFMGTVYPSAHEQDSCNPRPPTGLVVEILDASGAVALSLPVRATSGNFMSSSRAANLTLPYTARVKNAQGQTLTMQTPQESGDCNLCHTEQGANGAAGRIVWPQ
jgi:hypothetical protein